MNNSELKNEFLDFKTKTVDNISFSTNGKKIILFSDTDQKIKVDILRDVEIDLIFIFLPSKNKIKNINANFEINLNDYSVVNFYIANLANYSIDEEYKINLLANQARLEFYSSCFNFSNYIKNTIINPIHISPQTYSNIVSYEVLKNESKGFIKCSSDIRKGASGSEAHQEIRLIVLDKTAKAHSDPILLIDENDIVASHANAIGMLDQEQIFYLLSKGLDMKKAQELIINGFFEPVIQVIEDESLVKEIKTFLEGVF